MITPSSPAPARRSVEEAVHLLAPGAFALLTFAAGALTLASVATPAVASRLQILSRWLPHAVIETSHFLASLAGVLLLAVAHGLQRRLASAWAITLALLASAALLSLLKGGDWEEAALIGIVFIALAASRSAFYRHGGVARLRLLSPWTAAIVVTLAAVVWIGLYAFRHVPYRDELWWTFVLDQDAPRTLRAAAGVTILAAAFLIWRWLEPSHPPEEEGAVEPGRIAEALAGADCGHADANLAYLGDKRFLWSESGRSFIQYGVRGRSLIAMGEPAGLAAERSALMWRFREEADRRGVAPVFYSVRKESLPEMIELGLAVQKIGETAIVPLAAFGLEGSARAPLRHARSRAQRDGCAFEIIPPEAAAPLLPELKAISDAWLGIHHGQEKGFTLGRFEPEYLMRFPMALVRVEGRPVAFANLWTTADKRELSVDLMRHSPEAPRSVMDFLFIELALWGKSKGYYEMDLGMAPLAGLEGRRLAPLLTRLGALVFEHGEAVYGFEGLRSYKDKFLPRWEPLYLAAPSRFVLAFALGDVALLTSGGLLKAIGRGGRGA